MFSLPRKLRPLTPQLLSFLALDTNAKPVYAIKIVRLKTTLDFVDNFLCSKKAKTGFYAI